jgi:molecular chaperone HtpG
MNRDEAISHLGTIAKSGTKEFFSRLSGDQQKDAPDRPVRRGLLLGLHHRRPHHGRDAPCRHPAAEGVRWESEGAGDFSIEQIDKPGRGTDIILHLREGEDEFLCMAAQVHHPQVFRPHSLPILMNKEEWDEEKKETVQKDELETVNQASALWTRSKSDHARAV